MNKLIEKIQKTGREINIMEVCGTHTYEIMKSGIKELLPNNIKQITGSGSPVFVTSEDIIDRAINLARAGCMIVTFGDLLRVKGTNESLFDCRSD